MVSSEYRFSIKRSVLDFGGSLNINPQYHLPHLNATLRAVQQLDESQDWSVLGLSEIENGIRIFKGPRLRTENLIVDRVDFNYKGIEAYYTPSAILQDKRDSVKWLDLSRATASQLKAFDIVRVQQGDLLVTRSGSIGRVAYITSALDGAIVSDDAIRIRISDLRLRAYVFAYLQSAAAQHQLRINEYGAVQQHLEPEHLSDLLVPIPADWDVVKSMVNEALAYFASRERLESAMGALRNGMDALLAPEFAAAAVGSEAGGDSEG